MKYEEIQFNREYENMFIKNIDAFEESWDAFDDLLEATIESCVELRDVVRTCESKYCVRIANYCAYAMKKEWNNVIIACSEQLEEALESGDPKDLGLTKSQIKEVKLNCMDNMTPTNEQMREAIATLIEILYKCEKELNIMQNDFEELKLYNADRLDIRTNFGRAMDLTIARNDSELPMMNVRDGINIFIALENTALKTENKPKKNNFPIAINQDYILTEKDINEVSKELNDCALVSKTEMAGWYDAWIKQDNYLKLDGDKLIVNGKKTGFGKN